jgi:hypothetical protein
MKTLKSINIPTLIMAILMVFTLVGTTGCASTKSDFHKKKWKIRKSQPPVQRYYNKWHMGDKHRN